MDRFFCIGSFLVMHEYYIFFLLFWIVENQTWPSWNDSIFRRFFRTGSQSFSQAIEETGLVPVLSRPYWHVSNVRRKNLERTTDSRAGGRIQTHNVYSLGHKQSVCVAVPCGRPSHNPIQVPKFCTGFIFLSSNSLHPCDISANFSESASWLTGWNKRFKTGASTAHIQCAPAKCERLTRKTGAISLGLLASMARWTCFWHKC